MERKNYKGRTLPIKIKAHSSAGVYAAIEKSRMEGKSKVERITIAQMMALPFILSYKIFVRFPSERSMVLGAFRLVFFLWFMVHAGTHDWADKIDAFFAGNMFTETVGMVILASVGLWSYVQVPLSLLLLVGIYNGMQFPNGSGGRIPMAALDGVLSYRDSKMSNMTYDGAMREMADTGFLGAGGLGGKQYRNSSKSMDYLNSKLRNYSYEGGLNYIKSMFGTKT